MCADCWTPAGHTRRRHVGHFARHAGAFVIDEFLDALAVGDEGARSDIVLANRFAHAVLGHSLDELPPGTRRLLGLIEGHVGARADAEHTPCERVRFTRRALREALGWGDTQLKVHLARLVSLELIWAHPRPARLPSL